MPPFNLSTLLVLVKCDGTVAQAAFLFPVRPRPLSLAIPQGGNRR